MRRPPASSSPPHPVRRGRRERGGGNLSQSVVGQHRSASYDVTAMATHPRALAESLLRADRVGGAPGRHGSAERPHGRPPARGPRPPRRAAPAPPPPRCCRRPRCRAAAARARIARDGSVLAGLALAGGRALRLAGSDDPLLDRIAAGTDRVGAPGSFGGLSALWQQRADAATLHLRHRDGGYNAPFAAPILVGPAARSSSTWWCREQGIIVPQGNPRGVTTVADLIGRTVALRAAGTGTRVLLERLLRDAGSDPGALRGPQVPTHLEAALAVASGIADAAVGLRAAATTLELDFVPLAWEPYELALPEASLGVAADLLSALGRAPALPGLAAPRQRDRAPPLSAGLSRRPGRASRCPCPRRPGIRRRRAGRSRRIRGTARRAPAGAPATRRHRRSRGCHVP